MAADISIVHMKVGSVVCLHSFNSSNTRDTNIRHAGFDMEPG
jgi:hypothetical protein